MEKRTEQTNIRLSPVELATIEGKASAAKTSLTEFVRAAALGKRMTVRQAQSTDFETRQELRRIGVNLNQIAKALNAGRGHDTGELSALCQKLDAVFDQWLDHDPTRSAIRPKL